MSDLKQVERILLSHGFESFKWVSGKEVDIKQWVRFKCKITTDQKACFHFSPPIHDCREFFNEYENIIVLRLPESFTGSQDRITWTSHKNAELLKIEKSILLCGFPKAFTLFLDECRFCPESVALRKAPTSRPCLEAFGIDLYSLVNKVGFPIETLAEYKKETNRYAVILIS
jgi:predicted metal-binding protein